MDKHGLAKLFAEFDFEPSDPQYCISPDGLVKSHSCVTVKMYKAGYLYLPNEQECRELMESLLPDGWECNLVTMSKQYYVFVDVSDGEGDMNFPSVDTPSEAYLLAAQWLKDQVK